MATQKSRVNDTTPLHLNTITPHNAAALTAFTVLGGAQTTLTAPDTTPRFCRIITDVDAVITLGTDVVTPAAPLAGDFKILANTPEWVQLPHDTSNVEKPRIKISGVGGAGNASVTWHK